MEYNATRRYSIKNLNFSNISQEEDTRVLATSYMLYKIGRYFLMTFNILFYASSVHNSNTETQIFM